MPANKTQRNRTMDAIAYHITPNRKNPSWHDRLAGNFKCREKALFWARKVLRARSYTLTTYQAQYLDNGIVALGKLLSTETIKH